MDRVNQLLEGIELWVMRARKNASHHHDAAAGTAKIQMSNTDGNTDIILSGHPANVWI